RLEIQHVAARQLAGLPGMHDSRAKLEEHGCADGVVVEIQRQACPPADDQTHLVIVVPVRPADVPGRAAESLLEPRQLEAGDCAGEAHVRHRIDRNGWFARGSIPACGEIATRGLWPGAGLRARLGCRTQGHCYWMMPGKIRHFE